MPKRSERTKKKKFRRRPSGKAEAVYVSGKPGKHHCTLCGAVLHGMPHSKTTAEVGKLSKTQRRPSALFAGTLCTKCRTMIVQEAALLNCGAKQQQDIELRLRKFVQAVKVI